LGKAGIFPDETAAPLVFAGQGLRKTRKNRAGWLRIFRKLGFLPGTN
jgi:hypothetical protein